MVHKKIAFLIQLLMSFVLAPFCASLYYFHAASFMEGSAVKKQHQEVICLVENERVRVLSWEKCRCGTCKQPKLAFPEHQSKARQEYCNLLLNTQ